MIYVDTSVLVAYYAPELLSDDAERVVRSVALPAISGLVEVELFSAVARKVRQGELLPAEAEKIRAKFLFHLDNRYYLRLPLDADHTVMARNWLAGARVPLRTLDALHLAIAARAEKRLVTADRQLARAADLLGLDCELLEEGSTETIHEPASEYG